MTGLVNVDLGSAIRAGINAGELYPIIMGMLGLGTLRTVEGIKNVKSNYIRLPKK